MGQNQKIIYLDYAAATPLDERVFAVMRPFLTDQFYNPSSPYMAAKNVRNALNEAKDSLARVIGAKSSEIIMTAGATESINLAIRGVASKFADAHVVTTAVEHPAVLESVKKHAHSIAAVQSTGLVDVVALKAAINDDTVLVSVGYVNNELGTVQPLKDIAVLIREVRAERLRKGSTRPVYLHSDASQAAGYFDLNVARLGIDMLTLNAAKCYGPKQTGLLWAKAGIQLEPLIVGGGQERNLRSGTESPANVVGFAEALRLVEEARKNHIDEVRHYRDDLQKKIINALPETVVNGSVKKRAPNHLHIAWPGVDAERVLFALDGAGILVATGSACAANKGTRSHVLTAVGMPPETADGSIRITLGRFTSRKDIDEAADKIVETVKKELAR